MWSYQDLTDYADACSQDRLRPLAFAAVRKVARIITARLGLPDNKLEITDGISDLKLEPAEEGAAATFALVFKPGSAARVHVTCIEHGTRDAEPTLLELRLRGHTEQDSNVEIVKIKHAFSEAEEAEVAAAFSAAVRTAIRAWP